MLPVVVLIVFALIAATAGLGALLAWLTPVDALTAYLATTPGGCSPCSRSRPTPAPTRRT
jgi:uncharacterized membrane protein AbrB (regulator of aidB expression)